jgi:hypothetical protein
MNSTKIPTFSAQIFTLAVYLFLLGTTRAAEEFSVSLRTDKSSYFIGEPVFLTAIIEYGGNALLEVNHPLDSGSYKEVVEVAFARDSKFVKLTTRAEYSDAKRDRRGPMARLRLEPGAKLLREHILLRWYRGLTPEGAKSPLVFSKFGEYRIRFSVLRDEKRYSSEMRIVVSAPTSAEDKAAWSWLQQHDRLDKFCQIDDLPKILQGVPNSTVREKLPQLFSELLNQFPASVYAKSLTPITTGRFGDEERLAPMLPQNDEKRTEKP